MSLYFQPRISVSSLMRFMNSRAASSMPTSMATTRSKITVSRNVSASTSRSLRGAQRQSRAKARHWLML